MTVFDDLGAEQERLEEILAGLDEAQWLAPSALLAELVAITVANAMAAVVRFAVLRAWIFRPDAGSVTDVVAGSAGVAR